MTSNSVRGGGSGGDVKIAVVAARTIVGSAAAPDHSSAPQPRAGPLVDWSPLCGLVANASNALVNVVDPVTMQSVQVLDRGGGRGRSPVTRVRWARAPTPRHPADRMTLAAADASGNIVVWNVKAGEAKCTLSDAGGRSSTVAHMEWLDTRSDPRG